MIYWINVFDIGIGNGLKNEIAYSIATKDENNIKKYISSSYAVLTIISIFIFIVFFVTSFFINWNNILNIPDKINLNIHLILTIFIGFFCIQFVLQLLDAVISATQQVFVSSLILFLGQLVGLIIIYLLSLFVPGSLLLLVVAMAGSSIMVVIVASLYLYKTKLKKFAPSYNNIDFKHLKKIINTGGYFFVIQISAMTLIHANNFIITKILGPEAVTIYYIPFRLFSFITMLFTIIIMPYWSAFTDAYATKDLTWIKSNVKKLRIIWLLLAFFGILVFIFANFLYKIWIPKTILIPVSLSFTMLLYVIVYSWQTLHVYFLNGIGKIKLQLFVVIAGAILNIPLAIYLGKKYGLAGIVSSNTIIFFIMGMIFTIQYNKIVNETAFKIWNK